MNREIYLQAVFARDARFDGSFVYGVTSTRIFCRPSCPSKRPKAENIALFASVEAAQTRAFALASGVCRNCSQRNSKPSRAHFTAPLKLLMKRN